MSSDGRRYRNPLCPHLDDIKLVESVRGRATKMVHGIQQLNYDDILNYPGLMRLEKRRVRNDLNETFYVHERCV